MSLSSACWVRYNIISVRRVETQYQRTNGALTIWMGNKAIQDAPICCRYLRYHTCQASFTGSAVRKEHYIILMRYPSVCFRESILCYVQADYHTTHFQRVYSIIALLRSTFMTKQFHPKSKGSPDAPDANVTSKRLAHSSC